jgi:hypothetical protein
VDDELRHHDELFNPTHKQVDRFVFERAQRLLEEGDEAGLLVTGKSALEAGRPGELFAGRGPSRPKSHGFKRWGSEAARKALAEMPRSEGGFADEAEMRKRTAPTEPVTNADATQESPPHSVPTTVRRSLFDALRHKTPNEQPSGSPEERF